MSETGLTGRLEALAANVFGEAERERLRACMPDAVRARYRSANEEDARAWASVKTRADWERLRDQRIALLKQSLGAWPAAPAAVDVEVTGRLEGEGFRVENLLFESRPGLVVTANLYQPEPPRPSMPGILICHSHHNPKTHGELQDMGMNWARQGALVLVPDMVGHGERRQQPFGGREDYHHRYILGMQLHLAGESLIGWMAWDLLRGLDVLLSRPGIDRGKVIVLGSVAGGGDPVAVAVALDGRVTCSVPFNFGSAETMRADPRRPDAPRERNFAGNGSWESTRNLRLTVRDGFFPWLIVAAAAPRYLVSAHEFEWHPDRDPVWERHSRVYQLYDAADKLAYVNGRGDVSKRPPEATHCNHVGPPHRKMLYPILERWLGMPPPEPEDQKRVEPETLACLTPEAKARRRPKMVYELAADLAAERAAKARAARARLAPAARRQRLREEWARILGPVEPRGESASSGAGSAPRASEDAHSSVAQIGREAVDGVIVERLSLEVEPGITVPTLLLLPAEGRGGRPVVVGVAQEGKERFLKERAGEIADLLGRGVAVCLPDVRGVGETQAAEGHAWQEEWNTLAIWVSSSVLMFGETMLGLRLRDVRSVLSYLRTRSEVDGGRMALWGDAFSPANAEDFEDPPLKTDTPPHLAEPLGQLLALLAGLFEEGLSAVAARNGLVGFASALAAPFCYIPHDVHVPGVLEVGDIGDLAAALAPAPLRIEGLRDGRNRAVAQTEADRWFQATRQAYAASPERLVLGSQVGVDLAGWLAAALGR